MPRSAPPAYRFLHIAALLSAFAGAYAADANPFKITEHIPSQNGFMAEFGKHKPGDVLTLDVEPDQGCTITKRVVNPGTTGMGRGLYAHHPG